MHDIVVANIGNQLFKKVTRNGSGRHTLRIEFRQGDDTLKRANQNYYVNYETVGGDDVAGASRSDGIGDAILQSFTGRADAVPANV